MASIMPAEDGSHNHTPMRFLPPVRNVRTPAAPEVAQHAAKLRAAVFGMQFPAMCPKQGRGVMYYHTLPQVGFGLVIEYATMHQAHTTFQQGFSEVCHHGQVARDHSERVRSRRCQGRRW